MRCGAWDRVQIGMNVGNLFVIVDVAFDRKTGLVDALEEDLE